MKKLLLLFCVTLLCACSGDDSNSTTTDNSEHYFHPPAWIQGTWSVDGQGSKLKFTTDDFCTITTADTNCYQEDLTLHHTGTVVSVDETITPTQYKAVIRIGNTVSTYDLRKGTDTTIEWVDTDLSSITLTKI